MCFHEGVCIHVCLLNKMLSYLSNAESHSVQFNLQLMSSRHFNSNCHRRQRDNRENTRQTQNSIVCTRTRDTSALLEWALWNSRSKGGKRPQLERALEAVLRNSTFILPEKVTALPNARFPCRLILFAPHNLKKRDTKVHRAFGLHTVPNSLGVLNYNQNISSWNPGPSSGYFIMVSSESTSVSGAHKASRFSTSFHDKTLKKLGIDRMYLNRRIYTSHI